MSPRQSKSWAGQSVADLRARWGRECVYTYGSVESTNDVARELGEAGAVSGSIVVCREQKAGRGRGENTWVSPAQAGLYLSMLVRPARESIAPLVTVLAGVDSVRALNADFPTLDASIKWPNDLIARDRKLGGILAETTRGADGGQILIVGIGVNAYRARLPVDLEGAVALDECVDSFDLPRLADAVIRGFERRIPGAPTSLDEAALDELDGLDWLKNRRVKHQLPAGEPAVGVAAGIAPDGALLLRPDRGALRRVVAGSVEVVRP